MIYKYLKVDGTFENIESEYPLELAELQRLVAGYIEFFEHHGEVGCCDENGLINGKPINPHFIDKRIAGDVIIGKFEETEEERVFVGVK